MSVGVDGARGTGMTGASGSPFGEQLRRLREAVGLTQEELAERAGLSRDAVAALERGRRRRPHPGTVRALAAGLGLSDREALALRASVPERAGGPPPVATRSAPLPAPATRLVGRRRELAELRRLLAGGARLVTLTGPGGVGKTRLALAAAADLRSAFAGGVAFVPLAPVADAALVPATIAAALGVREGGGRSPAAVAGQVLGGRRLLLVLDNFEHLIEAAASVGEFLAACPGLVVLTTSRAPLRLSGEQEYPVPPLAVPRPEQPATGESVAANEAVALFVQQARAGRPDFALTATNAAAVAEICARLDGLPLAIELAAARVKVLPPGALLARLGQRLPLLAGGPSDQPPRLRTMRDAIGWSYDLLDDEERAVFRRLAVFAGDFALDAAEWVAGSGWRAAGAEAAAGGQPPASLDTVASLVEKSLLQRLDAGGGEPRFGMLATVQEYALERLAAAGEEAAARQAHAGWFLGLAEEAWPTFRQRAGQEAWLHRLEAERGNLRAALRWLDERGDAASRLRLAGALAWFWYIRGPLAEGRSWLERALAVPDADVGGALRVRAMVGAALLAHFQGDDERAEGWLAASLARSPALGDPWLAGFGLLLWGMVAEDRADYDLAEGRFAEALPRFRAAGDRANAALTLTHLGVTAWGRGDVERAKGLYEEALAVQREADDGWGLSISLGYLGLLAGERGDFPGAAVAHRESLRLRWAVGVWEDVAASLADLAALAAAAGRAEPAARLFGAAAAVREEMGRLLAPLFPERGVFERAEARARAALGPDGYAAAEAAGRALEPAQAVAEATALADEIAAEGAAQPPAGAGVKGRLTPDP